MTSDKKNEAKGDASKSSSSSSELSSSSTTSAETTIPAHMSEARRRRFLQQMVQTLPTPMQGRVTALKNMQVEYLKLHAEYEREVLELEEKHAKLQEPFFLRRKEIVSGEYEPPKQLPKWKPEPMGDSVDVEGLESYKPIMEKLTDMPADSKGIPNFWLTVLLSTRLYESVKDNDEPALKKLMDIRCVYGPQYTFTLEFRFDKNEYFSNEVLTKQYFRKCAVDDDYPFGFEGPEITHCKGCKIDWAPGKNLTTKTLRKREGGRSLVKHIETESFFKFFSPPTVALDEVDSDDDNAIALSLDFELADFYRLEIIPKAVLYYSGEIVEDTDDEDDETEEEEGSDTSGAESDKQSASADELEEGSTEGTEKGSTDDDANCSVE